MREGLLRRFAGRDPFVPRYSIVTYVRPHCLKLDGEIYSLVSYEYADGVELMFYAKELHLLTVDYEGDEHGRITKN